FNTDHEAVTQEIITSPDTEINEILRKVSPDFPEKVASVISHEYSNPQVVQLISSQIDADRMDYLLRDAYFTGAVYGQFDLTFAVKLPLSVKKH
ncbi:phosphohydrolase, partial [Lactococcus lactis]